MKRAILFLITFFVSACTFIGSDSLPTEEPSWNASRIVSALDKANKKIAESSNRYQIRLERLVKQVQGLSTSQVYIDPKINLFMLGNQLRVNSGLMDIMRDDELISMIVQEQAHNKLGHYRNLLENVSDGYEQALDRSFTDSQNSSADAYTLNFFIEKKLEPQAVVNSAYKLAKIEEKVTLLGADISYSNRLINKSSRDRAKAVAAMLQEGRQNPQYLAGLIQNEEPITQKQETIVQRKQEKPTVIKPAVVKTELEIPVTEKVLANQEVLPVKKLEAKIEKPIAKPLEKKVAAGVKSATIARTKVEVPSQTSGLAEGWYLQISAEGSEQAAISKVQMLTDDQLRGAIQETVVSGRKFYRVLVGPYVSQGELVDARKSKLVTAGAFARYIN